MPAPITIERVRPDETARTFGVGHYRAAAERGINVSQLLEQLDPTDEYKPEERGLDAFERVMRAAGIVANPIQGMGIQASTYGEATATPERRALTHEFMARVWRGTTAPNLHRPTAATRALILGGDTGLNTILNPYVDDLQIEAQKLAPPVPLASIVARTVGITGDAYRALYLTDALGTDAYRMKRVAESADIPRTTLVTSEHTVRLQKFGRALQTTYEQLRRQTLDRIAFIVARMAIQAEADKVALVLDAIVNGDGNSNTAATVLSLTALDAAASAGTLTLKGWLVAKARFGVAYMADTVLAQEASTMQLLLLPVNTVNGTPMAFVNAGAFGQVRPINDMLSGGIRYGITSDAPTLKLVMFDSRQSVERIYEMGGTISEVDRFIANQTELLTMTETEGYMVVDPYAARILNINA